VPTAGVRCYCRAQQFSLLDLMFLNMDGDLDELTVALLPGSFRSSCVCAETALSAALI
jgi:hypothetical protein